MGQPSPALVAAVNEQATARGIDPAMLLAVIGYETGGTYDTEIWGGRNNNYFGLIQFGPSERATYGVREGMTPAAQVTAALNFLEDRGFRPGMTLLDMYSTINAGSPGHYNRSDGNGTVRQHAARIERDYLPTALQYVGAGGRTPAQRAIDDQARGGRDPEYTRQVQTLLNENGANLVVDGKWGRLTQAAWDTYESGRARRGGLDPVFTSPPRGGGFGAGIVAPAKGVPAASSPPAPRSVQRGVAAPSVGKPVAETLLGPGKIASFLDGTSIGRALNTTAPGGAPVAGYTTEGGTPWSWYLGAPDARSPYYGLDPLEYGLANNAPYRGEIVSPASPSRGVPAPASVPTITPAPNPAATLAPNNLTLRPERPDASTSLARSWVDAMVENPRLPSTDPKIAVGHGRSGILPEFPALNPSRPGFMANITMSDVMRNEPAFRPSMLDRSSAAIAVPTEQAPSPLASWLTSLVSGVRPAMETVGRGVATANNTMANFAAPSASSIGNAIAAIFGGAPSSAPASAHGGYVAPFNPFER